MARKNPKTPDAAHPLSCVLYIRVSTKLQVEKGESIDAQRFELTRYAENHDMRVFSEYVDAGFSGKNVQGRPQFRQMMDDIIKAQPSKRPSGIVLSIRATSSKNLRSMRTRQRSCAAYSRCTRTRTKGLWR